MNVRRVLLAVSTAVLLVGGTAVVPALAGSVAPHDMIASPNTGPVGTHVTISNAENSPCGAQEGDGPVQVEIAVHKPDGSVIATDVVTEEDGSWSVGFIDTDLVGDYVADAFCEEVGQEVSTRATDFSYTPVTFVITAAEPTSTTAAPTTTSTAAPAAAVDATAAFTG